MNQVSITCPHCGFSRTIERQRIPAGTKSIKCPQCQQSFAFETPPTAPPRPELPARPVSPAQPPPMTQPVPPEQPVHATTAPTTPPVPKANPAPRPAAPTKFCAHCGQPIHARAEICPKCGVRVAPPSNAISKLALLLITFFLGGVGGHKFYQKKYLAGALYFLFFWTYIPALIAFVEFILYAVKSEAELQEKYPEASNAAIVFAVILPLVGIAIIGILAAIAIPQFAAYRDKARSVMASNDLKACKAQADAYFAQNRVFPVTADQLQCQASKDVALYYLSQGSEAYQIVSFHDSGQKAFLVDSGDGAISENNREEIEQEIQETFGAEALGRTFHFMAEGDGA